MPAPLLVRIAPIEKFSISRQQREHYEALQQYGELVLLRNLWSLTDFNEGLVGRCVTCQAGASPSEQARVADVYKGSAGDEYCLSCFGVGYEGGFHPQVFETYMLAVDSVDEWKFGNAGGKQGTGFMQPEKGVQAQFLHSPIIGSGDLIRRMRPNFPDHHGESETDMSLWQIGTVTPVMLRTGTRAPQKVLQISQSAPISKLSNEHHFNQVPFV